MKTTDLFKNNRSSKRLNESLAKTFGKKINFESFDTEKLEDARNKLRTQIYTARSTSGFNETVENDALTQAQWMHDAIVAELMDRQEHIVDNSKDEDDDESGDFGYDVDESAMSELHAEFADVYNQYAPGIEKHKDAEGADQLYQALVAVAKENGAERELRSMLNAARNSAHMDYDTNPGGFENWFWYLPFDNNESVEIESAPPTAKGERMVKHIKQGYADDGKLTDKEKSIAYATAWKQHNKDKNESVNTGDTMTRLQEGEIQQASAIVTAKTMVDRVSRWIEELSGMENDTLLQLGDSIRDEMGQEQAKQFISSVAPAIQQALENLKTTRESLSTGVRALTGEEQPTDMIGGEPGMDMEAPAEPDMMNAEEPGMGGEIAPEDEFGASEAGAGGLETAGREQRESIDRSNSLLKVLAG